MKKVRHHKALPRMPTKKDGRPLPPGRKEHPWRRQPLQGQGNKGTRGHGGACDSQPANPGLTEEYSQGHQGIFVNGLCFFYMKVLIDSDQCGSGWGCWCQAVVLPAEESRNISQVSIWSIRPEKTRDFFFCKIKP